MKTLKKNSSMREYPVYFLRDRLFGRGGIPVVIACDPGNKSFSKYDPNQDVRDRPEEAKEILNLSSGAYNNEIWLKQYQQKLEKKPLNPEYHVARDTSSQNSLKSVFDVETFNAKYIAVRGASVEESLQVI